MSTLDRLRFAWVCAFVLSVVSVAGASEASLADEVAGEEVFGSIQRIGDGHWRFEYAGDDAETVALAGSWDDWTDHALARGGGGRWNVEVRIPDGEHMYRYVVDGFPGLDPANPRVDLGPDGGLVSLLSAEPGFGGVDEGVRLETATEDGGDEVSTPPMVGPLELGGRYHGIIEADLSPSGLPENRHALDMPLRAGLSDRGSFDALLVADPGEDRGGLRLFRLRSSARIGRARVEVTKNAPLGPESSFAILQPMGRYGHRVGADGEGVSIGTKLGANRADALHLVRETGLLGPGSRISAASLSGQLLSARWHWSFARETGRQERFVDGRGAPVIPVPGDTVTVETRRSQGWQAGVRLPWMGIRWFADFQMGTDEWVAEDVVRHLEPGSVAEAFGGSLRSNTWMAAVGSRREAEGSQIEWSTRWVSVAGIEAKDADIWQSSVSWEREDSDGRWRLGARHRVADLQSPSGDPLLAPWVWRGSSDIGEDDEMGRVPWRELSLLGLPQTIRIEAQWARSQISTAWASTWGSDGGWAPLLSVARLRVREELPRGLGLSLDVECVGRDQGGVKSWTLCPFVELTNSPSPGLLVALGVGVDPWVDDPTTRELAERGREDHLRSVSGYGTLSEGPLDERMARIREAEHDLAGRLRVGLEVIYEFGLRRTSDSKGR